MAKDAEINGYQAKSIPRALKKLWSRDGSLTIKFSNAQKDER